MAHKLGLGICLVKLERAKDKKLVVGIKNELKYIEKQRILLIIIYQFRNMNKKKESEKRLRRMVRRQEHDSINCELILMGCGADGMRMRRNWRKGEDRQKLGRPRTGEGRFSEFKRGRWR